MKRPPRLAHDRRIQLLALAGALPALLLCAVLLWTSGLSTQTRWTLFALTALGALAAAGAARQAVARPLQTLSNLLGAMREEDFSFRARVGRRDDPLGEAFSEVNALAKTLREQRLGALEATALLRKVMEEIDVAVFAFDHASTLRLMNRAGERLLGTTAERLTGLGAEAVGLAGLLAGETPRIADASFPGASGRFDVRRGSFRQGGRPMQLLVLADVSRALRDEERQAWQRLIRVIGHELNNSLAPIRSVAGSLVSLLAREPRPADWEEDARRGLGVIAARAEALRRFMDAYAQLARLPPPKKRRIALAPLVRRVAGLETRVPVTVSGGPEVSLEADPDQLEQLLINLTKNAAEAAATRNGTVRLSWCLVDKPTPALEILVDDDGPGLPPSANLFVPFFTTKPGGSGIGLVLCRQIAEAHGGTLSLANRPEGGCRAVLRLGR
ncbi:MAG TPA: ATP-binding protein [Vicinamibacteria bacterium]|nr:ATP-binding protein [Vicinamibacteria bacterium]